jgi:hypothetical protein
MNLLMMMHVNKSGIIFFKKLAPNNKQGGRGICYTANAKEFVATSEKLKSLNWNGREIHNRMFSCYYRSIFVDVFLVAFQTSVALAAHEAKQNG